MENSRNHLKISSIVVLIFAGLALIKVLTELLFGDIAKITAPAGSPENIVLILKIILLSVSFICLIPQIYVGIKGLRIAKNPDSSHAHIIWAFILFVITLLELVTPVMELINHANKGANILYILSTVAELVVFFDYIKYAREVYKAS